MCTCGLDGARRVGERMCLSGRSRLLRSLGIEALSYRRTSLLKRTDPVTEAYYPRPSL